MLHLVKVYCGQALKNQVYILEILYVHQLYNVTRAFISRVALWSQGRRLKYQIFTYLRLKANPWYPSALFNPNIREFSYLSTVKLTEESTFN
jgi:hypothetical protein